MTTIQYLYNTNTRLAAVALGHERAANTRELAQACSWAFGHLEADEETRSLALLCARACADSADVLKMGELARYWRAIAHEMACS